MSLNYVSSQKSMSLKHVSSQKSMSLKDVSSRSDAPARDVVVLDAISLRSDVISSIKILSSLNPNP